MISNQSQPIHCKSLTKHKLDYPQLKFAVIFRGTTCVFSGSVFQEKVLINP